MSVIGNGVDLSRFRRRGPLPRRPTRALCFSNYADEGQQRPIRLACSAAGMSLDVLGAASGRQCPHPEAVLGAYDVARAADWRRLRAWNFGRALCTEPLSPRRLLEQLRRYDPDDAAEVCRLTRAGADLDAVVAALLRLSVQVIEEQRADPPDAAAESRALAEYLCKQRPYPLLYRLAELDRERESWRRSAEQAHEGWKRLQAEYDQVRLALELARAGWQRAHDEAEMLREALRRAEAKPPQPLRAG
jgi:hypothetical protein